MAADNRTLWKNSNSSIRMLAYSGCMMSVRKATEPIDIYIPKMWIEDILSEEEVQLWHKIGNDLLFPAKLEMESIPADIYLKMGISKALLQFQSLNIEADPKKAPYVQSDASQVLHGVLDTLSCSEEAALRGARGRQGRISMLLLHQKGQVPRPIGNNFHWNGYAEDFRLMDTKENLSDYIQRKMEEYKSTQMPQKIDCYKFIIDCGSSSLLSIHHKLAILSFYRFLWSNLYKGIVKDTLYLVNLGASFWDALYGAMSKKGGSYNYYYALLSIPGYNTMENVVQKLKEGSDINTSFTNPKREYLYFNWNDDDSILMSNLEAFVKNGKQQKSIKPIKLICTDNRGVSTLTKDKEYEGEVDENNTWIVIVKADDWITRRYNLSRFTFVIK